MEGAVVLAPQLIVTFAGFAAKGTPANTVEESGITGDPRGGAEFISYHTI